MQASKGESASNPESSNSNSTEQRQERAWQAVARPWSPQGVTNEASTIEASINEADVADSANRNESERLRSWYAESSKDQVYNAIGYVRLTDQEQSRSG